MTPDIANAFYMPEDNSINMIPGLMQFPLFDSSLPAAINLASYGWVIGHELTHGFDNDGRLYDGLGREVDWWSQRSIDQFQQRSQCFVDQYSNESVFGFHINGTQTLGENIADNGGIGLAWRSFQSVKPETEIFPGIPNDQLFWIWAAQTWCATTTPASIKKQIVNDVHSPFPVRGHAPMQNMPQFAQTFKCSPDSDMGRSLTQNRCVIW